MSSEDEHGSRERLAMLGEIAMEIAHELRNGLQVISASAYLARQEGGKGNAEAALGHVSTIERNARAAHGIVDDLMALARGEALRSESVALAETMAAARAEFAPEAAQWDDRLDPSGLLVLAHPSLLARLLHALYENSVHATAPRRPRVTTRAWENEGHTIIEITDDGPGVPAEIAARIFDALVTNRPGGTGLGLALARRIASAHGGSIELVDRSGSGAAFRIELPVRNRSGTTGAEG
jgi:two-component system, NtrC family, sensor histidine kinase HydH